MSFDEVVPKLKALLRKKITNHKCIFDAPKFLEEILDEFTFFKRTAITAGLALRQSMKNKIIKSIENSVDTLVMYCKMEYEPDQIEAATNNMADLIINNIVEKLKDDNITDKWEKYKEYKENHHKGGRHRKSILRRTRKQKGLRKRRGKKSQQKSRRNKRSSRM